MENTTYIYNVDGISLYFHEDIIVLNRVCLHITGDIITTIYQPYNEDLDKE